jgi:hypothetical protein
LFVYLNSLDFLHLKHYKNNVCSECFTLNSIIIVREMEKYKQRNESYFVGF